MLRRVSSIFQLIRTSSWRSSTSQDASREATPSQSTPKSGLPDTSVVSEPKTLAEELTATAQVLSSNQNAATERKEFDASLRIVEGDDTSVLQSLPYTLAPGFTITAEGHLRAYANAGLVGEDTETAFHAVLRENPAVALAVTTLHIVVQGPQEINLDKRDATMATQRKGINEWAQTIPALKNLTRVKVSHLRADEGGIYVPGEDEAEKLAPEAERGSIDVSLLMKALTWYTRNLKTIELDGVDVSEEAARAFEGSQVASLRLEACPARVSSLIPRLTCLSEIVVVEQGHGSVGCDYLSLLSHIKDTLTAISLTLRNSKIDLQEFVNVFSGASLAIIQCPFSTELTPEETEQKLKDAFPAYGRSSASDESTTEVSTPMKKVAESDMDIETTSTSDIQDVEMAKVNPPTSPRKTVKRSTIIEKRKEELKIAAAASEKSKLVGATRKTTRPTPQRLK